MFGPNTHLRTEIKVSGSHRDPEFRKQLVTLRDEFATKFGLGDFRLAFMLGGGSLGVEALMHSIKKPLEVIGVDGTFTQRWKALASLYSRNAAEHPSIEGHEILYCQLETSVSKFQHFADGFVDAVSSFPYQPIPGDAKGFVTSANKVLGSMVGLTIVGVRKDLSDSLLREEDPSYLSLKKYFRFLDEGQTPSTTSTQNVVHLLERVRAINVRELQGRIDHVSDMLSSALGQENLIGSMRGPVLTVKKERIRPDLADKWCLYGKPAHGGVFQIFTYSCPVDDYEAFCRDIEMTK